VRARLPLTSDLMPSNAFRTLVLLLAALVAACSAQAPTPTPTLGGPATESPTAQATPTSPQPSTTSSLGPIPSLATPTPGSPTPTPINTPPPSLPGGPLADAVAGQLDDVLAAQQVAIDIPGLTGAVVFPDSSEWDGADGFADLETQTAATTNTTFVAGSITKTFVTVTIMQLAEEGVLSIDDPLSNWLPDYPRAADIQLVHLLSHTSGVFNYFEDPSYNTRVFTTDVGHNWTPQEILDEFAGAPYCDPGACFHYSNTGFILLGLVIEQATGQSLGQIFHDRFFVPLSMNDTYFQADGPPPPGSAIGYLDKPTGEFKAISDGTDYRPTESGATVAWAAGGIVSTAHDLSTWVRAVYGGELLSPDSLALMTGRDYSPLSDEIYGLGTRSRFFGDHQMFGHTGSLRGYYAAMWFIPDLDLSIVVMSNRGRFDPNKIVDALAAIASPLAEA
jgi:D-alanyl-D-alanine carboxypeptidase